MQILDSVEKLKRKLQDLDLTPQGHIHIGTTTSIAIQILPRVLSYFQNQYPLIHTTIHTMPSTQIMAQVDDGSIDIGIAYLIESNPSILSSVLYYDTFELVVSPENTLAQREHISAQELHDTPFIMLSPDTAVRRFVDQLFHKYQLDPPIVMELSSSEEVKRMVELDLGAAIISKMTIDNELLHGTLKMIKVDELIAPQPVAVMVKSGRYLNSALEQFLDDLKGMSESQFYGSE
jgi:DNA-binding transcriptional LysR family regulator